MKIYTKTGDKGTTSLYNGKRIPKNSIRMNAIGAVDELNAHIGLLCSMLISGSSQLEKIMSILFDIGSVLATPLETSSQIKIDRVSTNFDPHIKDLETLIDKMDEKLPKLKNFILPTGVKESAQAHICRAVCRRAERDVCEIDTEDIQDVKKYLNRLSDYFFQFARYCNLCSNVKDVIYKKST